MYQIPSASPIMRPPYQKTAWPPVLIHLKNVDWLIKRRSPELNLLGSRENSKPRSRKSRKQKCKPARKHNYTIPMKKLLAPIMRTDSVWPYMQSYSFWSFEKGSRDTVTGDEIQKVFSGQMKGFNFIRTMEISQASVIQSNILSWRTEDLISLILK
jgi:hypothetical protein